MESLKEQKVNLSRQEIILYFNSLKKESILDSLIEIKDIENLKYNDLKNIELIKTNLITFIQTPFAISYYYNIIKKIYPNINITKEELTILLVDYIKTIKIFLIPMKKDIYVLTLFDGIFCINKNHYVEVENNNSYYNINIYVILFQELTHAFIKLLSAKFYVFINQHNNDKNNNNCNNIAIKLNNKNNKKCTRTEDILIYDDFSLPKESIDKIIIDNNKGEMYEFKRGN